MLKVEGLSKRFGGITALDEVTFEINEGEIVGLVGPNGAGKTTLINIINGILKPDNGKIIFNGRDITGLNPFEICKMGISRTFQSVQVFHELNAIENVAIGAMFGNSEKSIEEAKEHAIELLRFVGFPENLFYTSVDRLNFVELKRIQLARALATDPQVIMLDEVTTGLTPSECDEAVKLIKKIRKKGITILMVEHIMRIIMKACDRIIVLNLGKKIAEGTPDEVANNEKVIESYLGERFLW